VATQLPVATAWEGKRSNLFEYLLCFVIFSGFSGARLFLRALLHSMMLTNALKSSASEVERNSLVDGFKACMEYWKTKSSSVNDSTIRTAEKLECSKKFMSLPQKQQLYYKHGCIAAGNLTAIFRSVRDAMAHAA
jgi:hypothetical protein